MDQRVGTCSLCGGDVMGFRGTWGATIPPPPDRCASCGAVVRGDVIEMVRPGYHATTTPFLGTPTTGTGHIAASIFPYPFTTTGTNR